MASQKVIVLGAGVVGVTTAYYLAERGCSVTVIDSAADVASGASHANGGQLSYSFVESFAQPGFLTKLPGLLRGHDSGSNIRSMRGLLRWGLSFLFNCTPERAKKHSLALLEMAARSAVLLEEIRENTEIEFSFRSAGKLVLLGSNDEVNKARPVIAMKQAHGIDLELLSTAESVQKEPTLAAFEAPIAAAIYSKSDEVADSRRFTSAMRRYLEKNYNVSFRLNTTAERVIRRGNRIVGVDSGDAISADAVVVCLGAWSGELLRSAGVHPNIVPVRGYSITLPTGDSTPLISVTSLSNRFVISRLNGGVRIAGFADFFGFGTSSDKERIQALVETARRVAPSAADYDAAERHPWGGFRPMTPSGLPYVGATKLDGLYLNTGHGMFGWTLACATAEKTAHAIANCS